MWSRTQAAFLLSCKALYALPKPVSFWTWTFKVARRDDQASQSWSYHLHDLQTTYYGRVVGIRVFELHREHGLHIHGLISGGLDWYVVDKLWQRWGGGRLECVWADWGAAEYLAKYLLKDFGCGEYLTQLRRWARIGKIGGGTKSVERVSNEYYRFVEKYFQGAAKLRKWERVYIFTCKRRGMSPQQAVQAILLWRLNEGSLTLDGRVIVSSFSFSMVRPKLEEMRDYVEQLTQCKITDDVLCFACGGRLAVEPWSKQR